jgi:hypothetical protein
MAKALLCACATYLVLSPQLSLASAAGNITLEGLSILYERTKPWVNFKSDCNVGQV